MRSFDAIIIGAGQAGPALAGRLNDAGMSGAIIERHLVGGTCVNTAASPRRRSWRAPMLPTPRGEAIHGILDMMNADQSIDALRWAVPIHPIVSELIPTILLELAAGT